MLACFLYLFLLVSFSCCFHCSFGVLLLISFIYFFFILLLASSLFSPLLLVTEQIWYSWQMIEEATRVNKIVLEELYKRQQLVYIRGGKIVLVWRLTGKSTRSESCFARSKQWVLMICFDHLINKRDRLNESVIGQQLFKKDKWFYHPVSWCRCPEQETWECRQTQSWGNFQKHH